MICKTARNKYKADGNSVSFEIAETLHEINAVEWNKIAGHKIFLRYDYLQALEHSKPSGISFRYVVLHEGTIPIGICYFQCADLTSKELGSIINFENYGNLISSIANSINELLFSTKRYSANILLVCGSLFVSGEYGIACVDEKHFPLLIKALPSVISRITDKIQENQGRVIAVSVKDFYEAEKIHTDYLLNENFHRMIIDPNMIFHVQPQWKSFDNYLDALSAKYRLRANNTIKKLEGIELKYLEYEDIVRESAIIDKLYHNVQKKAPVRIARVDMNYFLELKNHLKNEFVMRGYYLENKMIAFTSGFIHARHYEAHFIGLDYHFNKSHALYQNMLYDFINEAIKNNTKELVFGRTAMEIKSTVGAVAHPLVSYIKFSSKILNRMIKPFIPSEENKNWIPRSPFKITDQDNSEVIK